MLAAVVAGSVALAPTASAAPGESQVPIPNPDLVAACGIDILVILDESGSIANAGATDDVKTAFRAFTAALNNTGSRMAVAEFSSVARLPLPGAASRQYVTVTDASIASTFEPYINGFNPGGSTNWEDGFRVGRYFLPRPTQAVPHLTLFITDGNPNRIIREDRVDRVEYATVVPLADSDMTDAGNDTAAGRAVPNANALKTTGSHILAVAVGDGLSGSGTLNRLISISDDDVFPDTGPFDISTTDIYREEDFSLLQEALRDAAFQLCAPSVNIHKSVDENPDPAVDDLQPGHDWTMEATVAPTPAAWVLPPGATGSTATGTTGADGFVNFQWSTAAPVESTISVTETVEPGYENDPSATTCVYITPDVPTPTPMPDFVATDGGFSGTIPADAIVTCEMVNRIPPNPSVDIEKHTNGFDADEPTGPIVPITGLLRAPNVILWEYIVTNTGNIPLSGIEVTDDQPGVVPDCPATTLGPGESFTCTARSVAVLGQYANTGSVSAEHAFGDPVTDSDPSHYLGVAPGIDVEKATNGQDADLPPGPFLPVGTPITWTYVVTNTGTATMTGITLADDQLGDITAACSQTTLEPDASTICTVDGGPAEPGLYANVATATGTAAGVTVSDQDPSHYFGSAPAIELVKTTNDEDANTPTGPLIPVGDAVLWNYIVTNTGNVPLTIDVTDSDLGAAIACPRLAFVVPGGSVTCFASGTAVAGQYANTGTVEGTTLITEELVTDDDDSHYFGVAAGIDLVKFTNDEDANEPPGPFVPVDGTVTWTYMVTNTGNSDLTGIRLVDSVLGPVTCPATTLAVGAPPMTCTASGSATVGQYSNISLVVGLDSVGNPVADIDPSHYFGAEPGITLQKYTNGVDADEAPGPFIPVGDPVDWTYVVTNSGNSPLSGVEVTDDQGVAVTCPQDTLAVGEEITCTATGTSAIGQYANVGSVTATDTTGAEVADDDPSHYFGTVSAIGLTKLANGDDANVPPGITVPEGSNVTMTFVVTNPGNVPIKNVVVTDDRGLTATFIGGDANTNVELDPGEVWTYQATAGPASGSNLNNVGTVTGVDLLERPLTASDPANVITPGAPRPIPRTGAEAMPLVFLGMALLVTGGGLLLGRRQLTARR
jgi:LPXTG-motif cell wall-anchored protein